MLTFRRTSALLLLLVSFAALSAQTPPAASTPPKATVEKLTLTDAIQRALAKNYSIKQSSFDVSIAKARVLEQLGIFDPKLTGNYGYSDSVNPQLVDPNTGLRPTAGIARDETYALGLGGLLPWGLNYSVSANSANARDSNGMLALPFNNFVSFAGITGRQPLLRDFGFGATTAQIRIAMTGRHSSEWQFRGAVIDNVTRVIFAYYDLAFAQASLRSALKSRDLTAQLVDENTKRFQVGSMSEYDVISARSRLASREDGILQARQFISDSQNALKALISDERTTRLLDWQIEIELPSIPPLALVDPALDFVEALKKRPDYQQALLAVKSGDINNRYLRNQLLPRVDLVGSYGYNGYDTDRGVSERMVRNNDYRSYSYGLQVTVPLTSAAERGRSRAARFQLRQAETALQGLEQSIVVSVGNAAGRIETAYKRVVATRTARELGQLTLEGEIKRLNKSSSGSTFNVLYQQEILTSLDFSADAAVNDYLKALAEYDRQLGVTLEKLNLSIDVSK
jgi:outer membrane protein TolC